MNKYWGDPDCPNCGNNLLPFHDCKTCFDYFAKNVAKECREQDLLEELGDAPKILEQHEPGAKMDQDKMDLSLLQLLPNALFEVSRVMDYGQTKYTRGGFLQVPEAPRRYTSAMWRHWLKELFEKFDSGDPFYDTDKGLPFKGKIRHDAQVAVNALFRLECTMREEQEDEELLKQAEEYDLSRRTYNPGA